MSFFRRKPRTDILTARLATGNDQAQLAALIETAALRFLTSDADEIAGLFQRDPTAVLEESGRIVGAASFGWRTPPVAWLRTLLLDNDLSSSDALEKLARVLHIALRQQDVTLAAVTVDDWSATWLGHPLARIGYVPMVEVVGYEKYHLDRPARGNQVVRVRPAQRADTAGVLALDATCFPLPWVKGEEILEPAILSSPFFVVAEFGGELVGYAFLTGHRGGQLFHLVRIAVAPAYQGRGIGVRMLAEVVDYCASRRAYVLTLNTQADNHSAQRLYEWFGFTRSGERQTVLGYELAR
jgi:ribosomal protein S18 acetylase RimI-like enzyme